MYVRILSSSHIYHVMCRGNNKNKIFYEDMDRYYYMKVLRSIKEKTNFQLYAYCLMDNHVHLLIKEQDTSISQIMHDINLTYVSYFNRKYKRVGHLFQGRFKSEPIEDETYLLAALRYIHHNPIKAQMVDRLGTYKWSSYQHYIGDNRRHAIVDVDFILALFSDDQGTARERFTEFSKAADVQFFIDVEEDKPIKNMRQGLQFIKDILKEANISEEELYKKGTKVTGTVVHDIVLKLRKHSELSSRDIAKLLQISKSTVNRLK